MLLRLPLLPITMSWFTMGLLICYAVVIVSCIVVVLRENRNPIRSLSWVIALIFLPFIGFIFYIFFGRSPKGMRMISRHNKRKLLHRQQTRKVPVSELNLRPEERLMVLLASNLCKSPLTVNNNIEIFTDGRSKFAALRRDLEEARNCIYLQYYIFSDDEIGTAIADILCRKASQGVIVRVIYDHVGSFSTKNHFFRRMREAGVDTHPFFRVTFPQLANRINWRNHRKIVVIDNAIGYIGGMNIADRYVRGMDGGGIWRDTHFRVTGDILESLIYSFAIDWNFLKKSPSFPTLQLPDNPLRNRVGLQLVRSGPLDQWDNQALCFLKAISGATKCIYIQTPYFLPTDALLHALETAALSKLDVRIMLPGKSDSRMLQYATNSYVTQCLRAGIKVYIYEPGMLHSKVMIIDEEFATVGSTNFDFRSFENNFECNLLVYDPVFNREMRNIFFADMASCCKLTLTQWRKRPLPHRAMESILRLLSPIL